MSLHGKRFNKESYVETLGSDKNTYRYYPCGVDKNWEGGCTTASTICQYSAADGLYHSIGETNTFQVIEAVGDGDKPYIKFMYTGGTDDRESNVKIICEPKSTQDTLVFLGEFTTKTYDIEMTTAKICPNANPTPSGGGGGPDIPALFILVLLVLFLATITYIVVGVLLMVFWKGARGLEVIPNLSFWKDFPFLFKDGVLFSFAYIPAARSRIGGEKSYSQLK
ncbi:hypothetical protein LOD99_5958 [Oopsacas minuta]|uniref:Autophagy-related protein 27 n=1 Tax=Oopsacas minuta TaxID=111878 RepID=A0AAV7JNB9_9METZ|nr:hypothetical protein LOD99_5958 [Oopsacas minuta]